jgi:hypothetical protein
LSQVLRTFSWTIFRPLVRLILHQSFHLIFCLILRTNLRPIIHRRKRHLVLCHVAFYMLSTASFETPIRKFSLHIFDRIWWIVFYLTRPLRWKINFFSSIHIRSNHTPIDRSRQTELECAVKVVLLTHFGMIWVHLCQKHMFSIEGFNSQNIAQIYAKITVIG